MEKETFKVGDLVKIINDWAERVPGGTTGRIEARHPSRLDRWFVRFFNHPSPVRTRGRPDGCWDIHESRLE